jgi:hypothetical protein
MNLMNVWTAVATSAIVAVTAWAHETPDGQQYTVKVCLAPGSNTQVFRSEQQASEIFARIRVKLDWRRDPRSCAPPDRGITITLSEPTEPSFRPGEMAYALPFGPLMIKVLYDRVKAAGVPPLMGYLLVHEIAHILSGTNDHASAGIMKSRWDDNDYADMRRGRLTFTSGDVWLIYNGLKTRSAQRFLRH